MLIPLLILGGLAIATLLLAIVLRPSDFRISRTAAISAPAAAIFAEANDFHRWVGWSPYEKFDPAMKRSYDGPAAGIGASYGWSGNRQAGEGRATIVESRPGELIRMTLEFTRPFACTNIAEFAFKPEGNATSVSWSLSGRHNFMGKAFGLVMNMDKMVGGQFEEGLLNLKKICEAKTRV